MAAFSNSEVSICPVVGKSRWGSITAGSWCRESTNSHPEPCNCHSVESTNPAPMCAGPIRFRAVEMLLDSDSVPVASVTSDDEVGMRACSEIESGTDWLMVLQKCLGWSSPSNGSPSRMIQTPYRENGARAEASGGEPSCRIRSKCCAERALLCESEGDKRSPVGSLSTLQDLKCSRIALQSCGINS